MREARRLTGHNATATCCIASITRPGLVITSGEDGCVCWFDMRCKDVVTVMHVGQDSPISSLCFKSENEEIIYVSSGSEVKAYDVQMLNSWHWLESHNYNNEEINQITCNSRSSFLAAADDGGDVKILDIRQRCLYKTLRAGHNICTSVQFLPWRPWEVITGGLDSKLVIWDFSKGRPFKTIDFGARGLNSGGQCLNPAFVHAIAVPDIEMVDRLGKVCVVARGDGAVEVIDTEADFVTTSKSSTKPRKQSAESKLKNSNASSSHIETRDGIGRKKLCLDYTVGGHIAGASSVAFSMFGDKGKYILSGGNDKAVKVWDCFRNTDADQTSNSNDLLRLNINTKRKINWLCTTPADSDNLVVCDTSKVVKVYTVA